MIIGSWQGTAGTICRRGGRTDREHCSQHHRRQSDRQRAVLQQLGNLIRHMRCNCCHELGFGGLQKLLGRWRYLVRTDRACVGCLKQLRQLFLQGAAWPRLCSSRRRSTHLNRLIRALCEVAAVKVVRHAASLPMCSVVRKSLLAIQATHSCSYFQRLLRHMEYSRSAEAACQRTTMRAPPALWRAQGATFATPAPWRLRARGVRNQVPRLNLSQRHATLQITVVTSS
jgi:hypothetical protein